ncbi:uncharacterized protein BHQ10_002798 [Talaromyces amestolkiae]|uniref:Required for respiratory growth protein 9, mitochondrial n=1 Tax=Talaromyces amestolkiae TaxID=1196081 RepID=A0A364KTA3_TALAM|nr:uncharacterized protein BHQ10_002798 [Talaromyces amestolkiae]RAO66786.1 hypothetical protein BHQ10_002798 [Talaromyces amestolkiae]
MAVCAASRRLTLSNVLQGVYRTELVRQHADHSVINLYTHRVTRPSLSSSWLSLSNRSFSTSQASSGANFVIYDAIATKAPDRDVLTELTSTKTETPGETQENPKSTSEKPKSDDKKKKGTKKISTKKAELETLGFAKKVKRPHWQTQKEALEKKFEEGWHPRKKLPPDSLDTIRHLHATKPDVWTTPVLADQFKISPEAIRRILKSKWQPTEEERERREARWEERYKKIYSHMAELGLRKKKGEWVARASDARALGLEEKTIRRNVRRRPQVAPSEPSEGTKVRFTRPDRGDAPKESASS